MSPQQQQLFDVITDKIISKAESNPSAMKKHMSMFQWGFVSKRFGKEKRFRKEVEEVVLEYINGQQSDVPPLDAYLRALGIDGYEIMMKIKDIKKLAFN